MNDLIKQFAIDCAGQKEWDFPKDPKSYTFTPDELEKFAELIVQECARIGELKEQGYEDYDPDLSVGWYMKQHFGVE